MIHDSLKLKSTIENAYGSQFSDTDDCWWFTGFENLKNKKFSKFRIEFGEIKLSFQLIFKLTFFKQNGSGEKLVFELNKFIANWLSWFQRNRRLISRPMSTPCACMATSKNSTVLIGLWLQCLKNILGVKVKTAESSNLNLPQFWAKLGLDLMDYDTHNSS